MKYNLEQLRLASQIDYKKGIGLAYMNAGVLANYSNQVDSGIVEYEKAENVFREINSLITSGINLNIATIDRLMQKRRRLGTLVSTINKEEV